MALATGTTSSGTQYFHSDNLGSQRLMTMAVPDGSGNIVVSGTDRTYLPFGWEWNATSAGSHYKFAGKERDSETGNDYLGARFYNPSMGRFLTPDWSAKQEPVPYADLSDPQSLNLFSYVRNKPTTEVDSTGHFNVTVTQYEGHSTNPFGHIGIGVNTTKTKGYYPKKDSALIPLGKTVPGEIRDDKQKALDTKTIVTTPEQDKKIQDFIDKTTKDPGSYDLYKNNCADFVDNALKAGGVQLDHSGDVPSPASLPTNEMGAVKNSDPQDPGRLAAERSAKSAADAEKKTYGDQVPPK